MNKLKETEYLMAELQHQAKTFYKDLDDEINKLGKAIALWLGDDITQVWNTSPAEPLRLLQEFRLKVTGRK